MARASMTLLTTAQAAAALDIGRPRVLQLIGAGRLPAVKHGRDWMIEPVALEAVRSRPTGYPKGRPRKSQPPHLGRREKRPLPVSSDNRDAP